MLGHGKGSLADFVAEFLEQRRLLSATLSDGGVIRIHGTEGPDKVEMWVNRQNRLVLLDNGERHAIDVSSVRRIAMWGYGGDDYIQLPADLDIPLKFFGMDGNDTAIGGLGSDTLYGNAGDDLLSGGKGWDLIAGDDGNDRLLGGNREDTLYGGAGDDLINSGARDDLVVDDQGSNVIDQGAATLVRPLSTLRYEPLAFLPSVRGYDPNQIRNAYNFTPLHDFSDTNQGWGQTIYIVDAFTGRNVWDDFAVFCDTFDLPEPTPENFQIINASGRGPAIDSGWAGEINLDVQWARAIAPEAKIVLVQADSPLSYDILHAVDLAARLSEADGGGVVSLSLGFVSDDYRPPNADQWDQVFARSANTTFVVASGDIGGIRSFPAFSPYVTAVGGTNLPLDQDGIRIADETGWIGSGGGETSWYDTPSYQRGITYPTLGGGIALLGGRGVPDVAYNADPDTGVAVYLSTPQGRNSGWFSIGGTSAGAPQWAGLVALINQRRLDNGMGVVGNRFNALLYNMYNNGELDQANAPLTDILSGVSGSHVAGQGYDLVSGLGVPNACELIKRLSSPVAGDDFYIQQNFKLDAKLSMPYLAGQLASYESNALAARPRSASGVVSGDDTLIFTITAHEFDWLSDPFGEERRRLGLFDSYSYLDPITGELEPGIMLYRTGEGRVYGESFANIWSTDPLIVPGTIFYTLRFEGQSWIGGDGRTHLDIDFWAIDPNTGAEIPDSIFDRTSRNLIYEGTDFEGHISA